MQHFLTMKRTILLTASFFLLSLSLGSSASFAQHPVLFETFTNTCDPCPDALRPTFDAAVQSVLSSEKSKIIYLNYHVGNFCDPMCQPASVYTGSVDQRLSGGATLYVGAVDRKDFGSGHASGTGTDWASEIDQESSTTPPATISLTNASLDKTASGTSYKLHADVTVTATQGISDNINIFFAVVQDGVTLQSTANGVCQKNPGSEPYGPYNSIVWYVTTGTGTPVFTGGTTSGTSKQISFTQSLANAKGDPLFDWSKMRLIAFIEESSSTTDYHVVNAADLKDDLDTLQPPPPTLAFNENYISGDTLNPGSIAQIYYTSTNLPHGVTMYYSLDNGTTWRFALDSQYSPITWTVPDSLTTQGKIKLVAVGDPSLVSIEAGTFVIAYAPSIRFLYPVNIVLHADSTYMVRWTKNAVGGVKLVYYLENGIGGYTNPVTIADTITDTLYSWTTPDTSRIVQLQLIPDKNEAPAASTFDTIEKTVLNGVATHSENSYGLSITDMFPNPATSGEEIKVQYSENPPRPVSIEVLDLLGRIVGEFHSDANQSVSLDTRSLASGTYIVRLSDGTRVVSRRLEIMR